MDDDDQWLDVITFGSVYEEQLKPRTGQWRHRKRLLSFPMRSMLDEINLDRPWTDGRAPWN